MILLFVFCCETAEQITKTLLGNVNAFCFCCEKQITNNKYQMFFVVKNDVKNVICYSQCKKQISFVFWCEKWCEKCYFDISNNKNDIIFDHHFFCCENNILTPPWRVRNPGRSRSWPKRFESERQKFSSDPRVPRILKKSFLSGLLRPAARASAPPQFFSCLHLVQKKMWYLRS